MSSINEVKISIDQFEELFHKNYEELCLQAVHYLKDADLAKDLVQDFFVYFWNKRDQIQLKTSFKAYAERSVKNICITYLKRQKHHTSLFTEEIPEIHYDPANLVAEENLKSATIEKLNKAIRNLPEQRRKLFLMSNILGYTYSEIAQKNNISINTVKTQIKLAYAALRSELSTGIITLLILINYLIFS